MLFGDFVFFPCPGSGGVRTLFGTLMLDGLVWSFQRFLSPRVPASRLSSGAVRSGRLCFPVLGRESAEDRVTSLGSFVDHHHIRLTWILRLELGNPCLYPLSLAACLPPPSNPIGTMSFGSTVKFTALEIANAPDLEPALEGLLRSNEVHEDIITAFRVQQIKTRALITALDSTEEGFKSTCKEAFGVDTEENGGGCPHKREWAKLNTAWAQAKITGEAIERINATKRAIGEPVAFLSADWTSLIRDGELPAQSYYEAFEEILPPSKAETLALVVSLADEKKQRASRPEPAMQLGLHLDSTLAVQTKRRYMATMPQNMEALSAKYDVLTNLWLLAESSATRAQTLLGPHSFDLAQIPQRTVEQGQLRVATRRARRSVGITGVESLP